MNAGQKTTRRKVKRPGKPEIDDDLRELASVLDEHKLDQNAKGWFTLPWRDGWCASKLGHACFELDHDGEWASEREREVCLWLRETLDRATGFAAIKTRAEDYWKAGDLLNGSMTGEMSPYLYASLRCLMIWISNSSGGGEVYNAIYKNSFESTYSINRFEETILEYRCRDAIGTTSILMGDANDRKRRAFVIAWRRGLFHAAYSIEPVRP